MEDYKLEAILREGLARLSSDSYALTQRLGTLRAADGATVNVYVKMVREDAPQSTIKALLSELATAL